MQKQTRFVELEQKTRNIQRTLFGERFVGATLAGLSGCESYTSKISRFMEVQKNFLVFCGAPGIGKTYFCASFVEWIIRNFDSFRYYTEADLFRRVRESIQEKGDYLKALSFMIDDQMIILDDIGSQGHTEWREEILFDTLDNRYGSMLPTIITSNLSREDFSKKYHPRLCSRLFASENIIIELPNGIDLRTQGK